MKKLLAFTLLLALAVTAGCGADRTAQPPTKPVKRPSASAKPAVGFAAPEITGVDLDGVEFNLSDYRGKVVMLDFWGDW